METTKKFQLQKICGTCRNNKDGRCYYDAGYHPPVEHRESCENWGKTKKGGED